MSIILAGEITVDAVRELPYFVLGRRTVVV